MLWPAPFNSTITLTPPCHLGCHCSDKLQLLTQEGQVSSAAVFIYSQTLVPGRTVMANPSRKLLTLACPVLLCFPAAPDQTQPPPPPKTQLSAQTWTFQHM